jgi:hypothetical protein
MSLFLPGINYLDFTSPLLFLQIKSYGFLSLRVIIERSYHRHDNEHEQNKYRMVESSLRDGALDASALLARHPKNSEQIVSKMLTKFLILDAGWLFAPLLARLVLIVSK